MKSPRVLVERLLLAAVVLGALLAALAGGAELYWHGRIFAGRVAFPLDLEWMEGGMLVHAHRLAHGQSLYVKPSLDFIPFLYTPLYPALLALLSKVFPLGYLLGRIVSIVAFTGALVLAAVAAFRQAPPRPITLPITAALIGVTGAGAIAAGFAFSGSFYDLARSDSLLLLFEATALAAALWGRALPSAVVAGVAIALGFLTKQTGPVVGVGIGLGLLYTNWRRGLVYAGVAGVLMGAGLFYLVKSSDGWFWTYIFKLHQSHPFRYDTLRTTPRLLWLHGWPTLFALILSTVGLGLGGRLRRSDAILWGAALAGIGAAILGFATMWAWANAFMPAVYFVTFTAAALTARLVVHAADSRRPGAVVFALACSLAFVAQSALVGKPAIATHVPAAGDRAAATEFLSRLRALPGDGFVPFHPFYSVLAHKRPFVHRMGVMDVGPALGRPAGLDQAILEQRFPWIILDWKSQPGEWPNLDSRYRIVDELRDGQSSVRMFAGAETSPRWIYMPIVPAPALPEGARRIADFEDGTWQGWTSRGNAYGSRPPSAPAGLFGRFAVNSGRFGPAATGTLQSPPWRIEHPHLRFTMAGPPDPALRVQLLLDGKAERTANPTGGVTTVEWDTADLVGREALLQVDDQSAASGFALDEFVAY